MRPLVMPRLPRGGGGAPAILRRAVRPVRAGWGEARRALLARVRPGSPAGRLLYRLLCEDFAREQQADLIVMGAYGHSRLREWAFGGATRDILQASSLCCLMAH